MGRMVLYSPEGSSLASVLDLQARAQEAGMEVTECAAGQGWSEVLAGLVEGDELVVDSFSCFASLNELLGVVASRGVRVRSLGEPWFSAPVADPLEYQCRLYALSSQLHAGRTRKGLDKAALVGRVPGRKLGSKGVSVRAIDRGVVDRVDQLRVEHRLTVVEACRQAGVSVKAYYQTKDLPKG